MRELGVVDLSYTMTLGHRADGTPIENIGVEPHRTYEPTERDLRTGYEGFRDQVLSTLRSL
jgi:hypothetical protein